MIKKCVIVLLIATCLSFIAVGVYDIVVQKQAGADLEEVISYITYVAEENDKEISKLRLLKERVPEMSHRDAAIYYRTLTKLYVLSARTDDALLTFIDCQINGELANAYDVIAWLYADIAQTYVGFGTYDLAKECIDTALAYGNEQKMDAFFYEYCYVQLADIEARKGSKKEALEALEESIKQDGIDMKEYQSMDLRRDLTQAYLSLEEKDYKTARDLLQKIADEMNQMEKPPTDILWVADIYYPFLELQTKLSLGIENYPNFLYNMEAIYNVGTLYGQMDGLMTFLTDLIDRVKTIETNSFSTNIKKEINFYVEKLIMDYPEAFQHKNMTAGTHIYNSNMATISVFVQDNRMKSFYKTVMEAAAAVLLLIMGILMFWRKSVMRSRIDGLTGAYIRKFYDKVYADLKKGNTPYGIIMYDIDFFKQVNDGFGHEAGDTVLREIAKTAMYYLDRNSNLYRYGGDEFCIICRQKTLEEMAEMAENIREAVEKINWKCEIKPTLSMGVANSASSDKDVKLTVDEKLYEAKEAGRNRVSW